MMCALRERTFYTEQECLCVRLCRGGGARGFITTISKHTLHKQTETRLGFGIEGSL